MQTMDKNFKMNYGNMNYSHYLIVVASCYNLIIVIPVNCCNKSTLCFAG